MIAISSSNEVISAPSSAIETINLSNPLELGKFSAIDEESVLSLDFSPRFGGLLAGISMSGEVKIWQVQPGADQSNWPLLRKLRDNQEEQIDEFLTGAFLPNGLFVAAGKRKHRHRWDAQNGEPQSLPGVLKIFSLQTGKCLLRLGVQDRSEESDCGHVDEILFLKPISTRQGNFIVTCGQDGNICRWKFSQNWSTFLKVDVVKMGKLVFHCDQISDELIAVAVDNGLIIYDILNLRHIRSFKTGFTSYCDFVKVLRVHGARIQFILRGVELLKTDTHEASAPNSIVLMEVDLYNGKAAARITKRFLNPLYQANSWLIKPAVTVNGEYLAAPTITGKVLIFNLRTGQLCGSFHSHDDCEVRQVLFHPLIPLMVSCGDDGRIRTYFSKE